MQGVKQIQQRLSDVKLLDELTSTFEAIAAQNLSATRNQVLAARAFLDEAQQVYTEARQIFVAEHQLDPKTYHEQLRVGKDNGKTLVIVVSPNTKLYGALPEQLLKSAVAGIRAHQEPIDVLVLGKVGVDYFSHLRPPIPFETMSVADEDWTKEQVAAILAHVAQYHQVTAYYNHFRTVLTADVLEADLTLTAGTKQEREAEAAKQQDATNRKQEAPAGKRNPLQYWTYHVKHLADSPNAIFEPSLEEVLNFFETVILKTLLHQKVRESLLSRYAARMVAMDIATENAKKATKQLKQDLSRAKRRRANAKMLDNYSGMTLWKN